ncbi:MAG: hypothetical protein ABI784_11095 [Ginsengibacter sp.]
MITICKVGRLFISLGIIAFGIQQLVVLDFRPAILPGYPGWAHTIKFFPIATGVAMIIAGIVISGILKFENYIARRISVGLGFYFMVLIFLSHIPYLLFVYPHKLSHLGSWGDLLEELAFSGSAFVVAGSIADYRGNKRSGYFYRLSEKFIPVGRIFFCITLILFGCNHFAYDLSGMIPKWFGMPVFWSEFGGAALIAAGTAILFEIFLKPVSLLLGLMLFLWFMLLHVPSAILNPYVGQGNLIVSAFDALLFCGTALLLSQSKTEIATKNFDRRYTRLASEIYERKDR